MSWDAARELRAEAWSRGCRQTCSPHERGPNHGMVTQELYCVS